MHATIMYGKGKADHFWRNSACASPGLDNGTVTDLQSSDFLSQLCIDERTFLE